MKQTIKAWSSTYVRDAVKRAVLLQSEDDLVEFEARELSVDIVDVRTEGHVEKEC